MINFTIFFEEQQRLLNRLDSVKKRYLYSQINWENRCSFKGKYSVELRLCSLDPIQYPS